MILSACGLMKLLQVNPPEAGNPEGSNLLFEFSLLCPVGLDLHCVWTICGEFKFKKAKLRIKFPFCKSASHMQHHIIVNYLISIQY